MDIVIGSDISTVSVYGEEIAGIVTAILEKTVIVTTPDGTQVVKKDALEDQGYTVSKESLAMKVPFTMKSYI